jgi:hypothetical protein
MCHPFVVAAGRLPRVSGGLSAGHRSRRRRRQWQPLLGLELGLQDLADEFGLTITVGHYPAGASKWNPIEHRMFNLISANWAGEPLISYEVMLKHIRTTRSSTGFQRLSEKIDLW